MFKKMVDRRYIHLDGKMAVEWDEASQKLVLKFLDTSMKPIPGGVPIVFREKQAKFLGAHIIISVSKEGYDLYKSTISNEKVDPLLPAWEDLQPDEDDPKSNTEGGVDDEDKMNTTNPPDEDGGGN